MSLTFRNH